MAWKTSSATVIYSLQLLMQKGCETVGNTESSLLPSNAMAALQGSVSEMRDLAEKWFLNSRKPNGLFQYLYESHADKYSRKNNALRQLMASRLLAELAVDDRQLQEMHEKNLSFIGKHWIKEKGDLNFIVFGEKSKLGANAMLLRTLVASPFFSSKYSEAAEKTANGILASMNADGSFLPFLIEPDYSYDANYLLTFYSGEAILALMEYFHKTRKQKFLRAAVLAQNFYIDLYINHIQENYYPAYVPWHCMALNHLYKATKDSGFAKAAFALTDVLLGMQDVEEHVGRFYNPATPQFGSPHTSSDGVYAEGLTYALELALLTRDEERAHDYFARLMLSFGYLKSMQYTQENTAHLNSPDRAIGGFRIRKRLVDSPFEELPGSNIRIDSTQHTMDAMIKFLQIAKIHAD